MNKKLILGIIGIGRIGKMHTENIVRFIPQTSVKWIADIIVNDHAKRWASCLGIENITDDARASVRDLNDTPTNVIISNENGIKGDKPFWFFIERYKDAYNAQMQSFIDAILNNKNVRVTGEDGLRAALLGHAAIKSLKEGRRVNMEELYIEYNLNL